MSPCGSSAARPRSDWTERIGQEHVAQADRRHPSADDRAAAGGARSENLVDDRARRRLPPGADRTRECVSQRLDSRTEQVGDRAIYDAVVEYSGLEHFIDVPIKNYSSGMHMRLGFAIAANLDPDILLLDEIFAVGDADFQQRCIGTVQRFMDEGKTIIFVSHSRRGDPRHLPARVRARTGRAGFRRRRGRGTGVLRTSCSASEPPTLRAPERPRPASRLATTAPSLKNEPSAASPKDLDAMGQGRRAPRSSKPELSEPDPVPSQPTTSYLDLPG